LCDVPSVTPSDHWYSENEGQRSAKLCRSAKFEWTVCRYHKLCQIANEYARKETTQETRGLWCEY
jgi:hypothetical protein